MRPSLLENSHSNQRYLKKGKNCYSRPRSPLVLFQVTCSTCLLIHTCGQQTLSQVTYFALVLETLIIFYWRTICHLPAKPFGII